MRCALILAVALALLTAAANAGDFSEGPKLEVHLGIWNYEAPLFGNGNSNGQNRGQYQPHRQYVISSTNTFAGSYYVESGHCYFQPPTGPPRRSNKAASPASTIWPSDSNTKPASPASK